MFPASSVAAAFASLAVAAALSIPGLPVTDLFAKPNSSSVRDWLKEGPQSELRLISWAEAFALATEELVRMEAKRAQLAEREGDTYGLDEYGEGWPE